MEKINGKDLFEFLTAKPQSSLTERQSKILSQTYIVSLDWTKICGPNWQFFDSTAEKQQKMC